MSEVLATLEEASARVLVERDDARRAAVSAIRQIETRLVDSLCGGLLRGLVQLAPSASFSLRAANVYGTGHGIDTFVPKGGRWALVIHETGRLQLVRDVPGSLEVRDVRDDELRIEDQAPVARAVMLAVRRHVERCDRRADEYVDAARLAQKLSQALAA